MSTKEEVGQLILEHYYTAYNNACQQQDPAAATAALREALGILYRPSSKLNYEGSEIIEIQSETGPSQQYPLEGVEPIVEKLVQVSGAQFDPKSCDTLANGNGDVSMMVMGVVLLPGQQNPLNFVEYFQVANDGNWHVTNQIFRFVYN